VLRRTHRNRRLQSRIRPRARDQRGGASDNLKEAVKALHLGLSRLAEQVASTAGHSTTQIAQVTDNLEKLAGHVGQIWEDADSAAQLLERRIDVGCDELGSQFVPAGIDCADTQLTCIAGSCQPRACEPGTSWCAEDDLYGCNAEGSVVSLRDRCAEHDAD
jgi:hypothetical protein